MHLRVVEGNTIPAAVSCPRRSLNLSRYDLLKLFIQVRAEDARCGGLDTEVGPGSDLQVSAVRPRPSTGDAGRETTPATRVSKRSAGG